MTEAQQKPAPSAPNWKVRALEQYSACLASGGKRAELETLVARFEGGPHEPMLRHQLAVALASGGNLEEALVHLRLVISKDGHNSKPRELAYRLLVKEAHLSAEAQDWNRLSQVVAEATSIAPPSVDPGRDLARFKNALPIAHLRAGRRPEAVRLWEQQLRETPGEVRLLHNLALAHYWWAQGLETEDISVELAQVWQAAIAYWTVVLNADQFWDRWNQINESRMGMRLSAEELSALRSQLADEALAHHLQSKASQHGEKGDDNANWIYAELIVEWLREKRSAETWREALQVLERHGINPSDPLLRLPGGYHFFERLKQLPGLHKSVAQFVFDPVTQVVNWASANKQTPVYLSSDCLARLYILFSPAGLGLIAVMIEERHQPTEAIKRLDGLPGDVRSSSPAVYLRIKAESKLASTLAGQGKLEEASKHWKSAHKLALEWSSRKSTPGGFPGILFSALPSELRTEAVNAVQKEAARLKKENKLDLAITLCDQSMELDHDNGLRDFLCVLYCDRAGPHLGASRYGAARNDFQRALSLNSKHQRAKEGMSTSYNNEGCDTKDLDEAENLLGKAIEINPNNDQARRNLAATLKGKAIQSVNTAMESARYLGRYSMESKLDDGIRMLERAAKLINNKVDSSIFSSIEAAAMIGDAAMQNMFRQVDDEVLRSILENLGIAYKVRWQVKRIQ